MRRGVAVGVGVSVGVAYANPDEALTAEGFLRRGEQILQETKRQERGWTALLDAQRPSSLRGQ